MSSYKKIHTAILEIAYEERGKANDLPVILLHGFPDDVRTWDVVAEVLSKEGFRTLAPYLRGYGPTRFRSPKTPRSGQQAALGQDVIEFADAVGLNRFLLVGYDWGGRAASIVSALYPKRVFGLVLAGTNSYGIYKNRPPSPPFEYHRTSAYWYQWFLNLEWGRKALEKDRRQFCRFLWQTWSPGWKFDASTFETTAVSWDNPDFVDVVIHSYRHRQGNAKGDPRYQTIENRLVKGPEIAVPTIFLPGAEDGVDLPGESVDLAKFTGRVRTKVVAKAGHFVPRERPDAIIEAVRELAKASKYSQVGKSINRGET